MNDREFDEIIARCVAIAVFYRGEDRTGRAADAMTSEIRATALALGGAGIPASEARDRVVEPVRLELMARFGPGDGGQIGQDFVQAFAGDDPAEVSFKVARPRRRSDPGGPPMTPRRDR